MKRIIVTGATSGFGRECVRLFLANGDEVIATGRRLSQRPQVFASERAQYPNQILEMDLDVTDATQRARVTKDIGRLDALVNNAGLGHFGACEFTDEATAKKVFDVNFFGAMALTRDLIPSLRESRGRIINISSVFGFAGFPLTGVYCASKFAMEGWSEALAYELRPHGIEVHIVQPGGHRTGFIANALRSLAPDDQGLSAIQQRGYQFFQDRLTSRPKGPGPEAVAKAILKLTLGRKTPLRCPVGKDAKAMTFMKAWLPHRLFQAVLFKMTKNAFSQEGKV